jgi:hypothetical protein
MPLDVLEADFVAPRRVDAQGLKFDLMVKVLQRDDPLRRSYLQRRWHGHSTSAPLSREVGRYNLEGTCLSPIVLDRR